MTNKKELLVKIAKKAGGLACVILGLLIGGFGVSQFLPEKEYGGGDIALPEKEEEKTE